jgi:bifunctional non-homologous end joining protein LigD
MMQLKGIETTMAAPLREYHRKRRFSATPEPPPPARLRLVPEPRAARARFCVQEHHASRLHYDFRLEMGGVLKSWAVPKGPSLDPEVRRLAVATEDHPLDYLAFEGEIPAGNYGAGQVIVWDLGEYQPLGDAPALRQWRAGNLKFLLRGKKLSGEFALVRLHPPASKSDQWLMIKKHDDAARFGDTAAQHPGSVLRRPRRIMRGPAPSNAAAPESNSATPVPAPPEPMLASLGAHPFSDPGFLFEIKWDGIRAFARCHAGPPKGAARAGVTLISRNHRDLTVQYPELAHAPFRQDALLDGEIVALEPGGRASFERLQQRMNLAGAADIQRAAANVPVVYYAFDLLWLAGRDLTRLPLRERKRQLAKLAFSGPWRYSDHVVGDGLGLFQLARRRGLEGIVAKRADAPYHPGRSRDWLKFKVQQQQEFAIVGYTDPQGARTGFGALLVAVYEPRSQRFVYAGRVGTGFDAAMRRHIFGRLRRKVQPAVAGAPGRFHPVTPALVAEVRFAEWTSAGVLRAPVFLGLRDDKSPQDCVREIPDAAQARA